MILAKDWDDKYISGVTLCVAFYTQWLDIILTSFQLYINSVRPNSTALKIPVGWFYEGRKLWSEKKYVWSLESIKVFKDTKISS